MTRRPGAQRKRNCLLRAARLLRVARVARVVCRCRMTRRHGAQRTGKCLLRVVTIGKPVRVTRILFSFCWPQKQGAEICKSFSFGFCCWNRCKSCFWLKCFLPSSASVRLCEGEAVSLRKLWRNDGLRFARVVKRCKITKSFKSCLNYV